MDDLKNVVGIGRLKISPTTISKNIPIIPTLHFMVIKHEDIYESVCLELILSSVGVNESESIHNLSNLINISLFYIY